MVKRVNPTGNPTGAAVSEGEGCVHDDAFHGSDTSRGRYHHLDSCLLNSCSQYIGQSIKVNVSQFSCHAGGHEKV